MFTKELVEHAYRPWLRVMLGILLGTNCIP